MPITPTEAADIARTHGLSLSDATALRVLADTLAEANELAAKFVPEPAELPSTVQQIADAEANGDRALAMQLKSMHLAEIRSQTDHDGFVTATQPAAPESATISSARPELTLLQSGAAPVDPSQRSLPDRIAEAQTAGNTIEAMNLKSQLLRERRQQMEGGQ